jgi:hypothetical protein
MKFSAIQNLYLKANTLKPDARFFRDFYWFCINSVEKIDDAKIKDAFEKAAKHNSNLVQFCVRKAANKIILELYTSNITLALKTDLSSIGQDFDLRGFAMWVGLDPNADRIALEWPDNWFDKKEAQEIFGNYLIEAGAHKAMVKIEFFTN